MRAQRSSDQRSTSRTRKVATITVIFSLSLMLAVAMPLTEKAPLAAAVGPSVVSIERQSDGRYIYRVDGQPQFLVGMGYNEIYRNLSPDERAAKYDIDFSRMHDGGVNTIMGWDADKGFEQDKFDQLTLDKALQYGLGVVMPFVLPPDGNYQDQAFRAQLKRSLLSKVGTYKDHPAVRMWGIGNEVMQGVVASGQADVFARFYLELADAVHNIDPNHPVIYRESEDRYLPYLTWYHPNDGVDRPWLLYGMNAYTLKLKGILDSWPASSGGMPLFITEFAPEGFDPADRPAGYVEMWQMITGHPQYVLGAAPYVWTTAGPEPGDRNFGLVDGSGNTTDGSLAALTTEFKSYIRQLAISNATPLGGNLTGILSNDHQWFQVAFGGGTQGVVLHFPGEMENPSNADVVGFIVYRGSCDSNGTCALTRVGSGTRSNLPFGFKYWNTSAAGTYFFEVYNNGAQPTGFGFGLTGASYPPDGIPIGQ